MLRVLNLEIMISLKSCDILLMQETWLYNYETKLIHQLLPGSNVFMKSSMNEEIIDKQGRPFGGCAVVLKNSM